MLKRYVAWLRGVVVSAIPARVRVALQWMIRYRKLERAATSVVSSLRRLNGWGFRPSFVVDIGAYEGQFTDQVRRIFPDVKVLQVEAQADKAAALHRASSDSRVHAVHALLGATDGKVVPFFVMETGSSVLREQTPHARTSIELEMETLDSVLHREVGSWGWPDFIKIDVQGYELEVLEGAQRALQEASCLLLEVSVLEYNAGAPLLHEVVSYLADRGFYVVDVATLFRAPADSTLFQMDLVFTKDDSSWRPSADRVFGPLS